MRPLTISENGYVATLTYDASGDRVKEEVTRNGSAYMTKHYIGGVYEKMVSSSSNDERLYLGGDYYSAPMVAVKSGSGSWTLYNILRDPQGSILKVTNSSGSTVKGEYSYDAWGRMRNPSTWSLYAADNQPSLYLDRGYTGHEHLRMFGIINMNARLYDPVLGRFFSPDPFMQAGDLSQSYNRYGYCMNNPMKYVDESGEVFGLDDILYGVIIAGAINLGVNIIQGGTHSVGQGLAQFISGAAGGLATLFGGPIAGGIVVGSANSFVNQGFGMNGRWNWGNISTSRLLLDGIIGGATGKLGESIGKGVDKLIGSSLKSIGNPIIEEGVLGAASGAASGFGIGTGVALLNGENIGDALSAGVNGALSGAAIGGISGVAAGVETASESKKHSVYVGIDRDTGEIKYVGITKRDVKVRALEHKNSKTNRSNLRFELYETVPSRIEARIMEQKIINLLGLHKYGGQLYNKINSINPVLWHDYDIPDTIFK